mgnify:CR=1 FL=1
MPEQSLRSGKLHVPRQKTAPANIGLRRLYVFGSTALTTLLAWTAYWIVVFIAWRRTQP